MDMIERFNKKFGGWYEGLFGETESSGLRPKDVLRKIIAALEEGRSDHFDGKVYVPNKLVLELALTDQNEKEYLLSFLDEEELADVLERYIAQKGYSTRGPLDFTISERADQTGKPPKLTVLARFEKGEREPIPAAAVAPAPQEERPVETDDLKTVAAVDRRDLDDLQTVAAVRSAWAALTVTDPNGHCSLVTISKPEFSIGRSRQVENDLVLAGDGEVSKRHARIEQEPDGGATIYDLGSTNGTYVNDRRVYGTAVLKDGDTIVIGHTTLALLFDPSEPEPPGPYRPEIHRPKGYLIDSDGAKHVLASETLIGRSVTSDIVVDDAHIATRQAQVIGGEQGTFYLEDLAKRNSTLLNDRVVHAGERVRLTNGDRIQFGTTAFQYLSGDE